jgi:putative RIP metalloprotease rseP
VGVDSTSLQSFEQLREYVKTRPNQTITLHVERGDQKLDLPVAVESASRLDETGREHTVGAIGVTSKPVELFVSYGPVTAIGATAGFAGSLVTATLEGLASFPAKLPGVVASIFGAEREADGPISVVGASHVGGVLAEHSAWPMFFLLLASLNFFLAFFNLVPLPPLDGGHIAVVLYERVRDFVRKLRGLAPMGPVNYDKLIPLTVAVAALLAGVGIIVIVADIVSPVQLFG